LVGGGAVTVRAGEFERQMRMVHRGFERGVDLSMMVVLLVLLVHEIVAREPGFPFLYVNVGDIRELPPRRRKGIGGSCLRIILQRIHEVPLHAAEFLRKGAGRFVQHRKPIVRQLLRVLLDVDEIVAPNHHGRDQKRVGCILEPLCVGAAHKTGNHLCA